MFTSNVQCVRIAAGRRTQAGESAATPLINGAINQTLRQFAPLSDDRLLQLADCRENVDVDRLSVEGPQAA